MEPRELATVSKEAANKCRREAAEEGCSPDDIANDAILRRKGPRDPSAYVINNYHNDNSVTNNHQDNSTHTKMGGSWFNNLFRDFINVRVGKLGLSGMGEVTPAGMTAGIGITVILMLFFGIWAVLRH